MKLVIVLLYNNSFYYSWITRLTSWCCTTSWDRPNLEIWATTTWNSKLSYAISRLACDWYRHLTATQRIMTGARSLMSVSCHDSSLPSKRIWWHIMTQGYLQMYKMIWNCVIGNFIVGKKLQLLCLFDQSAAAHLRWNADGRHELLLKTDSLMKTTATQVHSHCQKHMRMSRNYDS